MKGQTFSYFNKAYDHYTSFSFPTVIEKDNYFYCIGAFIDSNSNNISVNAFYKLDTHSNVMDTTILDNSGEIMTAFVNNSSILTTDGDIVLSYSVVRNDDPDNYNVRIAKIRNMELLWQKEYGLDSRREGVRRIYEASDGGYLVVGSSNTTITRNEFYVFKTDINGEEEWSKTYAWNNFEAFAVSAVPTDDGGFLIGGAI